MQNNIAFRGIAPSERLALGKVTVLNAEGRAVSYKQGGIVSSEKYRATGTWLRKRQSLGIQVQPRQQGQLLRQRLREKEQ